MTLAFDDSLSYKNGNWQPLHQLAWSVTDLGTTHGAMLVERLRTFGGRLVEVDQYLSRFQDGAIRLGIPWPPRKVALHELCQELVERNAQWLKQDGDVGLVLLLSPGDPGVDRRQPLTPTLIGHLAPLPFSQLANWYRDGVHLHFSSTRNVPAECWAPSIKTRSRLQYYLADRFDGDAQRNRAVSEHPARTSGNPSRESVAVLLSTQGFVTETSISNLIVLGKDGVLRSPPLSDILWGVSLKTLCLLAEELHQPIEFCDLHPTDMLACQEILMTGSTGCLWSAVSIDGQPIGDGRPGQLCARLQTAWRERIGFDFIEQSSGKTV